MLDTTQKLLRALSLWLDLSEVDPDQRSFRVKLTGGMDELTVKKMHDRIKEALELDESNITGLLMLDALSSAYFENRNFTVKQLLENPEKTAAYVQKAASLRQLIRDPDFVAQAGDFVSHLRSALKMYAMDRDDVVEMAGNLDEVAYLRRDAFSSLKTLRVDQFLRGQVEPPHVQPVYHGWVHQFWNVNSLVEAACRQPSGVTLSLVRDPDDLQSYFVFAVRNGGNLWLLSDVPQAAHPLQRYMTRKPARDFGARAQKNWFPYDLLNLEFDAESKQFFADETRRRALIPLQQTVDKLKPIAELKSQEILWLVMMFDLIVEKFWHEDFQASSLSYTGAMIREETPLLEAAQRANLPVLAYPTLALPALTRADMTAQAVATAVGSCGGQPNAWLEERYANQVDPELFNLLDNGASTLYLPPAANSPKAKEHKNHDLAVVTPSYVSVHPKDDDAVPFWLKEGRYELHAMPSTQFGTRQELENNRKYLARFNQAKAIQRLADEEFNQRSKEVVSWWHQSVRGNLDYLLSLAAQGVVRRPFEPSRPGGSPRTADGYIYADRTFNFVRTYDEDSGATFLHTVALHQGHIRARGKFRCVVTGAASSLRVLLQPQNAKQLAELAGCAVADLPDVLRYWAPDQEHKGNHILDRIDPMAWALTDPWCNIDFRVVLHLSKRGLTQCKKKFPQAVAAGEADAEKRAQLKGTTVLKF